MYLVAKQSSDISIRHFQKRCAKFLLPLCILSTGKLDAGRAFGQNKAELSKMLNIPRPTITSVLRKYRRTLAQWRLCPEVAGKEASQIETEML